MLEKELSIGAGTFGTVYSIEYEKGKCAAKQIEIDAGKAKILYMALEELLIMIKKTDRENIIKIKAFSYKINSQNHVRRFYIIMEQYKESLKVAVK